MCNIGKYTDHKRNPKIKIVDNEYVGMFPKLIIKLKDPELVALAGENLENFDNIDCKDIKCTCTDKPRYEQLFGDVDVNRNSILYNNCKRTLFAAAKRQIKSAPMPSYNVVNEFIPWAINIIEKYLGEKLNNFSYNYNQWYNHLPLKKQKDMDKIHEYIHGTTGLEEDHYIDINHLDPRMLTYEALCKVEVQAIDGKPRMVCSIPPLIKYVMGPITWALEELFSEYLPCYCGGKNLNQMEDMVNGYINKGFTIVAEGDGSAFDNTQDVLLKAIDRYVYKRIIDKIYHVPKELYLLVSQALYKVMDVLLVQNNKKICIMTYAVLGTVFSGDCDTTLMNTTRMGLYNWFTNEKSGLVFNEHFVNFSKGDDFTNMYNICVDKEKVMKTYSEYWLKKPEEKGPIFDGCDERVMGLGQILKFMEFGPPTSLRFCSLRSWYKDLNSMNILLTRDPAKFLLLSNYSRKALRMNNSELCRYCIDQAISLYVNFRGINYFEDMAKLYLTKAKMLNVNIFNYVINKKHDVKLSKIESKVLNCIIRDRRKVLPEDIINNNTYYGYDINGRNKVIKIVDNYWETVKKTENCKDVYNYSKEDLECVNNQIDIEFLGEPISLLTAHMEK